MEEQKKCEKMRALILDGQTAQKQFDLDLMVTKTNPNMAAHFIDCVESGDDLYNQLREEIKSQEFNERQISKATNQLANMSKLKLSAKLEANRNDFGRLKNLGSIGSNLEMEVRENDNTTLNILATSKDAHKSLINVFDGMKCNLGEDQKPYQPDLEQVDHTCKILTEMD